MLFESGSLRLVVLRFKNTPLLRLSPFRLLYTIRVFLEWGSVSLVTLSCPMDVLEHPVQAVLHRSAQLASGITGCSFERIDRVAQR